MVGEHFLVVLSLLCELSLLSLSAALSYLLALFFVAEQEVVKLDVILVLLFLWLSDRLVLLLVVALVILVIIFIVVILVVIVVFIIVIIVVIVVA